MKAHLYETKRHCIKVKNNITLTDAIKAFVMENRVWDSRFGVSTLPEILVRPPAPTRPPIDHHLLALSRKDPTEVIDTYLRRFKKEPWTLEDVILDKYGDKARDMRHDAQYVRIMYHDEADMLDLIESVCHCTNIEHMNILYNAQEDNFYFRDIYELGWTKLDMTDLFCQVMSMMCKKYFSSYEKYLIERSFSLIDDANDHAIRHQKLKHYYAFACSTGMGQTIDDYVPYMNLYEEIKDTSSSDEVARVNDQVRQVLLQSGKKNVESLYRQIAEMVIYDKVLKGALNL